MTAADSGPEEPATLQSSMEPAGRGASNAQGAYVAAAPTFSDPVALFEHLGLSGHVHRDSLAGRLYHQGMVSFREDVPTNSLHVVVDANRLAAHVDTVSPLAVGTDGPSRKWIRQALAAEVPVSAA